MLCSLHSKRKQRRRHGHKDGTAKPRQVPLRHENGGALGADPLPADWGSVVSSPSGSGAVSQPKTILVHFSLKIWHMVASILMIILRINWPNFVEFTQ